MIPANKILPPKGASAWANGNQIWKGQRGLLTQMDRKIAIHNIFWSWKSIIVLDKIGILVVPVKEKIVKKASNINKDPNKVYKNR